jgi:cytochrome P450
LARTEARIGLEVLLSRLGTIRLAADPDELEYERSVGFHGLKRLPLTADVVAGRRQTGQRPPVHTG